MTREEAIEILWRYDVNFEPHPPEEVMHAIDMAIEALEAKTEDDLISRQDAIEAVRKKLQDWGSYAFEDYRRGLYEAQDILEALPSADAVQGWIPVSDIRKLEGILLMKINSFEGTRNIVEKGMLEVWKEVVEYIDGMLGEDGEA